MAGLVKAKDYDWKDSNVALIGSDLDRQVKKEAAKTEPAWKGAGDAVGIQVWRIEKFKVVGWPKEDYGSFYNGDSYIILNTYKEENSDALLYDLHFWIGKHSTQVSVNRLDSSTDGLGLYQCFHIDCTFIASSCLRELCSFHLMLSSMKFS